MLSGGYKIVPMIAEHIGDIAALEKICFSEPWSEASLAGELTNSQAFFLVAVCGEGFAGYIGVLEICGEGYITNVAVHPRHRRRGVASGLIKAAAGGAKSRGCAFLTLEVRAGNAAAISLYSKLGFMPEGKRKNFYTAPVEDAVIMTLRF